MKISYDEIESAFLFLSMSQICDNQVYISRTTGQTLYLSEDGESDEVPDDFEESDDYIEIPTKYDLDLGNRLVFEFVDDRIPKEMEKVSRIFRKRGAYSKYKNLLERLGLLDEWHRFENKRQEEALRRWCADNDIELTD